MAKKIIHRDQSKELNRARFEFLKRNRGKYEDFLSEPNIKEWLKIAREKDIAFEEIEEIFQNYMGKAAVTDPSDIDSRPLYRAFLRCCKDMNLSSEEIDELLWERIRKDIFLGKL